MKIYPLFLMLSFFILMPILAGAITADELRKQIQNHETEIKKLEAEIKEYQNSLDKQSSTSQSLKNEIKKLETQIRKLNADIKLTEFQIQKTELRINELGIEISQKEKKVAGEKTTLAELLRLLDEHDEQSLIEVMFAYPSVSDFFNEVDASERLQATLSSSISSLVAEKTILEGEQTDQEQAESELQNFRKDLSGKKNVQVSVSQNKSQLLTESKNQESRYQKLLRDREAQRALIQKEMQSIEDRLKQLINPSTIPKKGSGVLSWPVANHVITQGFGFTEFATTIGSDVYKGNGHNGVDFKASIGTQILAAADGVIKDTGNTDTKCPGGSYGKFVIIEHENNLSTLYGHLSSLQVSTGQKVTRSQLIGYSGDTGYVTGPHLHFTVYASNTYRLHQSNNCGLIPAGGYVNPLDYL
jgi:murein DD-endopeptidase MepM/ murein hydrolase activator NlpD